MIKSETTYPQQQLYKDNIAEGSGYVKSRSAIVFTVGGGDVFWLGVA